TKLEIGTGLGEHVARVPKLGFELPVALDRRHRFGKLRMLTRHLAKAIGIPDDLGIREKGRYLVVSSLDLLDPINHPSPKLAAETSWPLQKRESRGGAPAPGLY